MMDDYEKKQQDLMERCNHRKEIVKKYKKTFPAVISPIWDTSASSTQYNNIAEHIIDSGISIYEAKFSDVWNGLFKPEIYSKDTLWTKHEDWKIAQVIENWELQKKLSPIFLVKHGSKDLALVADGKHRLTVSHYCLSQNDDMFPFMVADYENEWVKVAIPSAKKI